MQNNVELIGYYGSDITHAQSAWTSTVRDLSEEKLNRVDKLLASLAEAGHHTPFEKSSLHFLVNVDQATHIHLLKHRIGVSINGECLTGDNVITFNNQHGHSNKKLKKTVKELFEIWNSGRNHQNTTKDMLYNRRRIQKMRLRVLDESSGVFKSSHIKDVWYKGVQKVFTITLDNGHTIKCTDNHALFTKDGYKTLLDGLKIGSLVGCNGVNIEVKNKPWTFLSFYDDASNYTRKEFSKLKNLKYELIKKWGYIFNIKFKKEEPKFKIGHVPWNKNVTGYKININNRQHNPLKGKRCHFWRGGITSERQSIGAWTTNSASKVHKKYNYTCQNCGNGSSKLHAHHIIPVTVDLTKAYCFDNLITVCETCHKNIHKSISSEQDFAKKVMSNDFEIKHTEWGNAKKRLGKKLHVHYSRIISIEYIGEEETYDIEVEGINNNFVANNIVVHNSARYKELKEDKYYLPIDWIDVDYQGSDAEWVEGRGNQDWYRILEDYTKMGNTLYHQAIKDLTPILGKKRAKESARFFKTFNSQITIDIMFNWRSFVHFLKLRNDEAAQLEVRELAKTMLDLVKKIEGNPFQHTINAFKL